MPCLAGAAKQSRKENAPVKSFLTRKIPGSVRHWITYLAVIYAWCGEKEAALQQLKTSAELPTGITYGELKQSPDWDSLRGDPRFEQIVASLAPKDGSRKVRSSFARGKRIG